jgi:hypothetical protein
MNEVTKTNLLAAARALVDRMRSVDDHSESLATFAQHSSFVHVFIAALEHAERAEPTFVATSDLASADPGHGRLYSLCEAVADLAASFAVAPWIPNNSREMNQLCIAWAEEFERKHVGHQWGIDTGPDYIEAIDAYFAEKWQAWNDATSQDCSERGKRPNEFSAAPELLAALKGTLALAEAHYRTLPDDGAAQDHLMGSVISPARVAIAKVEGRS